MNTLAPEAVLIGILTSDNGAGAQAADLRVHGLPAVVRAAYRPPLRGFYGTTFTARSARIRLRLRAVPPCVSRRGFIAAPSQTPRRYET